MDTRRSGSGSLISSIFLAVRLSANLTSYTRLPFRGGDVKRETKTLLNSFAIALYFYPQMTERIASHWNAGGEVVGIQPDLFTHQKLSIAAVMVERPYLR